MTRLPHLSDSILRRFRPIEPPYSSPGMAKLQWPGQSQIDNSADESNFMSDFPLINRCDSWPASVPQNASHHGIRLMSLVFLWSFLISAITVFSPHASAKEYVVGPQASLKELEEVPWESLEPGDKVLIHARPEPYRSKWVICRRGTSDQPIVVMGIANSSGQRPVIDGRDALTRSSLNFWSEGRGIIKIGGANRPADLIPAHITIANLEIRSARPPFQFKGREGITPYPVNAASIFIEKGEDITISNCVLHDSGNGFFTSPQTRRILVEKCSIYGNGIEGSILEHNNYTSSEGITFQFNQFGPLREGCLGNNLKDRSAGLVVRYNWIEGGNRMLDLVDSHWKKPTLPEANYRETFVFGNILIKQNDQGNNQVVHYGGDSGRLDQYRMGMLYFYNNTVISERPATTVLFRLSSMQESVDCRNNIVWTTAPGRSLAIFDGNGTVNLYNNWLKKDWRKTHSTGQGEIHELGVLQTGDQPGWVDIARQDFRLQTDSQPLRTGSPLPEASIKKHQLKFYYKPQREFENRPADRQHDFGALPILPVADK